MNRKMGLCFRTVNNGRTGSFLQIEVAAYKIGVKMGFEDVFDLSIPFLGKLNVTVNVPKWVNNSRNTITFNVIGCLTQTAGIQLLYKHVILFWCKGIP